jgi:hypothetical protein
MIRQSLVTQKSVLAEARSIFISQKSSPTRDFAMG